LSAIAVLLLSAKVRTTFGIETTPLPASSSATSAYHVTRSSENSKKNETAEGPPEHLSEKSNVTAPSVISTALDAVFPEPRATPVMSATDTRDKVPCFDGTWQIAVPYLGMTKAWRQEHPFATGIVVGVLAIFAWSHRGWIIGLGRKLMHPSQLFHGGLAGLAAANGIADISTDPSIAARQMRRYAFAASQDKSPIVGITHASYALIALDILEEAVGREGLVAKGMDPSKIRPLITALQDMHAKKLEACDPYLASVLAMERGGATGTTSPSEMFGEGVEYMAPTGA
jgi:hypothetical protein